MNPLKKQNFMRPMILKNRPFYAIMEKVRAYVQKLQTNIYTDPKDLQN